MDDTSAAAAFEAIDDGEVDDLAAEGTGCDGGVKQCDHLEKLESLCVPATMSKGSVLLWSGGTIHNAGAHSPCSGGNEYDRDGATLQPRLAPIGAQFSFRHAPRGHFHIPRQPQRTHGDRWLQQGGSSVVYRSNLRSAVARLGRG